MDVLVDSLFLFSKLDTGQFPFKFNIVNMQEYIKSFYEHVKTEFYGKDVEVSFENKCKNVTMVKLDTQEMKRVLLNILDNSVKYKEKSKEKIKVKINLYEKEEFVVLEFSDNGTGVPDKDLSKLFLSFYRVDVSRTNPNEGSGLGLSIAKHIIEAHDGEITAYNMDGLTIKIVLPKALNKGLTKI